jgi:hypothetical protein
VPIETQPDGIVGAVVLPARLAVMMIRSLVAWAGIVIVVVFDLADPTLVKDTFPPV